MILPKASGSNFNRISTPYLLVNYQVSTNNHANANDNKSSLFTILINALSLRHTEMQKSLVNVKFTKFSSFRPNTINHTAYHLEPIGRKPVYDIGRGKIKPGSYSLVKNKKPHNT